MEKNTQKKVLIVEDDISLLNILFDKLSNQNYEVLKAEDGKKAIELVYKKNQI
jgi:DNA-binding response OmpR family regulator